MKPMKWLMVGIVGFVFLFWGTIFNIPPLLFYGGVGVGLLLGAMVGSKEN